MFYKLGCGAEFRCKAEHNEVVREMWEAVDGDISAFALDGECTKETWQAEVKAIVGDLPQYDERQRRVAFNVTYQLYKDWERMKTYGTQALGAVTAAASSSWSVLPLPRVGLLTRMLMPPVLSTAPRVVPTPQSLARTGRRSSNQQLFLFCRCAIGTGGSSLPCQMSLHTPPHVLLSVLRQATPTQRRSTLTVTATVWKRVCAGSKHARGEAQPPAKRRRIEHGSFCILRCCTVPWNG